MMCFGSANGAYRMIAKKGEGTFSEVLKAQCIKTSKYVAIKCMKNTFDNLDQVTNLREIQALQRLSPHPNIIKLLEAMFDPPSGRLALVFELMDMNIYELIRGRRTYVAEDRIKCYMYQLLKAMDHMHRNGIFHRDIKPENILIMDESLKLADFGSCRGVHSKQPYTEYISTRWYRAPECLLTDGYYSYKMDMWGVGCVFFEVISLFPLFPGTNELDQIQKIHKVLGTPPQQLFDRMKRRSQHADFKFPQQDGTGIARLIPHAPPACVELLNKLLAYNPDDRISARQALRHPYFKDLREREKLQQAFANASRCTSLRPSPRMIMPELAGLNKSKEEDGKTHITEKIGTFRNPSTASTPQSICSSVQLPTISASNRIKEDGKDTRTSSPLSLGDTRTPATLLSCGSTVALHRTMETTKMHMDIEVSSDASSVYPHHKSGHVFSVSPAKQKLLSEQSSFQYPANSYTTKAHTMKTTKVLKGSKGHRVLPEVSSKNVGGYGRTGDQPPYKKRASNTKYTSPYSHKYISQLTAMCHD